MLLLALKLFSLGFAASTPRPFWYPRSPKTKKETHNGS
jgi:hypothetical protein